MKRCSNCAFENDPAMKFCGACGTKLPVGCPSCGFVNPPEFRFCGECGTNLSTGVASPANQPAQPSAATPPSTADVTAAPAVTRPTPPQTPASPATGSTAPGGRVATTMPEFRLDRTDGERRQLTVLFCDLVDSTVLSEQMDAEAYRDLVREYQQTCSEVVGRFDGHIAQFLGDGLLVYFGYPHAHEDDARRAALAALGILDAMRTLNDRHNLESRGRELSVRIGIHTGSVVAGEVGSGATRERLAMGSTPNIAARLQSAAPPDAILLSAETQRLLQGWFDLEPLGAQELKGVSRPVSVFRVLREARRNGRFELDDAKRLSALVGRDEELALLTRRLTMAKEGNGFIVLLSGEAGVGKSRLVQAARIKAVEDGFTCVVGRSSSVHQDSALLPVADLLEGMIGFDEDALADEKLAQLEAFLDDLLIAREENVPLLAQLLSIPVSDRYPQSTMLAQRQKQRTLELMLQLLSRSAERRPVVLVMEDLHWADASTLEFLTLLVEQPPIPGLLAMFTVRPDFNVPWRSRSHVSHLTLSRLSDRDVRTMVVQMAGTTPLPSALITQVVQKTDGIPVFVEELTRMMLELGIVEGGAPVDPATLVHLMDVPETLQDSLLARLDRMDDAKDVAQVGAVLGRTFEYDLILAVSEYEQETLQRQLSRLVDAELLYQRGAVPNASYTFKHALIQDAAYALLLRSSRRVLHDRVASVLVERFPEVVDQQPELLAHHLTEAARTLEAVDAWTRAGFHALEHSAMVEAISQLRRGLSLLESLPSNAERDALELRTLTTLATAYAATRGYAAPETVAAYGRANEICERLPEAKELFWVIVGLWVSTYVSGNLPKALELANRLIRIAAGAELELRMEAEYCLGATHRFMGELPVAKQHLENLLALDHPGRVQHSRVYTALDIVTTTASIASEARWLLGDVEGAIEMRDFAIREATRLQHPLSLAVAETGACWLGVAMGDRDAVLRHATTTSALCEQYGLFLTPIAALYHAWVRNDATTIAGSIQMLLMGGSKLGTTHFYSLLAEAHWRSGDNVAALEALDAAENIMRESGEGYWDAELSRLRGEILRDTGDTEGAAISFSKAANLATERGLPLLLERARKSQTAFQNAHVTAG